MIPKKEELIKTKTWHFGMKAHQSQAPTIKSKLKSFIIFVDFIKSSKIILASLFSFLAIVCFKIYYFMVTYVSKEKVSQISAKNVSVFVVQKS